MDIINQWKEALRTAQQELAISMPIRSDTWISHKQELLPVIREFADVDPEVSAHMHTYKELADYCSKAIRKQNRPHAIATLRYLENRWLPAFINTLSSKTPVSAE